MIGCFHIVVAMKPTEGTFAENALKYGVSGINIDATRVETGESLNGGAYAKNGKERYDGSENWRYKREGGAGEFIQPVGRFPANVILEDSEEIKRGFPEKTSHDGKDRGGIRSKKPSNCYGIYANGTLPPGRGDSGSASRFFKQIEEYEEI